MYFDLSCMTLCFYVNTIGEGQVGVPNMYCCQNISSFPDSEKYKKRIEDTACSTINISENFLSGQLNSRPRCISIFIP